MLEGEPPLSDQGLPVQSDPGLISQLGLRTKAATSEDSPKQDGYGRRYPVETQKGPTKVKSMGTLGQLFVLSSLTLVTLMRPIHGNL